MILSSRLVPISWTDTQSWVLEQKVKDPTHTGQSLCN